MLIYCLTEGEESQAEVHGTTWGRWPQATRDDRVTTAHPGKLTNLLSATSFVLKQNALPTEPTATCLVDFEPCWSKGNIVVGTEARSQVSVWGMQQQLTQDSRQVHQLQTQPEPPVSHQGVLKSKPICLQKVLCYL